MSERSKAGVVSWSTWSMRFRPHDTHDRRDTGAPPDVEDATAPAVAAAAAAGAAAAAAIPDGFDASGASGVGSAGQQVLTCYREYGEPLFRYLMLRFRSVEDCEEVVHETFVSLLQTLQRGDEPIERPKAWLFAVARRTMLDRLKHTRHVERLLPMYGATLTSFRMPSTSKGLQHWPTEARVVQRELLRALTRGLKWMTPFERSCFLARLAGLKLREVAAMEDTDPRRVADAVMRGVEKVQRCLEGHRGVRRR